MIELNFRWKDGPETSGIPQRDQAIPDGAGQFPALLSVCQTNLQTLLNQHTKEEAQWANQRRALELLGKKRDQADHVNTFIMFGFMFGVLAYVWWWSRRG